MILKDIWNHIRLFHKDKEGVKVGSARKDARQVNITIHKKHIYFAVIIFAVIITGFFYGFIDNPNMIEVITCNNGTVEELYYGKTTFCGADFSELTDTEQEIITQWQ